MRVLIVSPEIHVERIEALLQRYAGFDWKERRTIQILSVVPGEAFVAQRIIDVCRADKIDEIYVPKRVSCGKSEIERAGFTIVSGVAIGSLLRGDALARFVDGVGLGWRAHVNASVAQYAHGTVDVEAWLRQFDSVGVDRQIGTHLLQLLKVVPYAELGAALFGDADIYQPGLLIGINAEGNPKSSDVIRNLAGKQCRNTPVLAVDQAIIKADDGSTIRFVEDGLYSATETRSILNSLLGEVPTGRAPKVPPLPDPTLLFRYPIELRYGVVCDYGLAVLREYLRDRRLINVQIGAGHAAEAIYVLREDVASAEGDFHDSLRARIEPYAFQPDKGWPSADVRATALKFCSVIGEQLWRAYWHAKGREWPDERIRRCALGMDGLGLTLFVPHSVPKATLPIFWARGEVHFNGRSCDWVPLFPNADT